MARTTTNDAKREEMAAVMAAVVLPTKVTAALLLVSTSAVSAWKRGDSMGTNEQRARLRGLATMEGAHAAVANVLGEVLPRHRAHAVSWYTKLMASAERDHAERNAPGYFDEEVRRTLARQAEYRATGYFARPEDPARDRLEAEQEVRTGMAQFAPDGAWVAWTQQKHQKRLKELDVWEKVLRTWQAENGGAHAAA
jgi:hypothetical protein